MIEREMQDLLWRYPEELLNEPLKQFAWETSSAVGRADLVFEDRHGGLLIVEVKRGTLPRGATDQLLDYYGMMKSRHPKKPVEMMVVANVIPIERRLACDSLNIECREISEKRFRDLATRMNFVLSSDSTGAVQTQEAVVNSRSSRPVRKAGGKSLGIHDSFIELMEQVFLRMRVANPTHIRLDGERSGGNWQVSGRFRHQGKVWKVHADTHYEPLLIAYEAMQRDHLFDPFVPEPTGANTCLVLRDELRRKMAKPQFKHLFIYEENSKK